MADISKNPLIKQAYEVCLAIEECGASEKLTAAVTKASALLDAIDKHVDANRMAPVQGYSAGIPWTMHLRAYDAYCKMYGKQQAMIEGWCRGGFSTGELDIFIPGWREEIAEINSVRHRLACMETLYRNERYAHATSLEKYPADWDSETEAAVQKIYHGEYLGNTGVG